MKKITLIGGGSGTSNLARVLKDDPSYDLSVIVSTSDSGGSTGMIRKEYGEVALGDVRQNLFALAPETTTKELFDFRFEGGFLGGHALGNILLLGLKQKLGSLQKAIDHLRHHYDIKGKLYPITEETHDIHITLDDGTVVTNEVDIIACDRLTDSISKVELWPKVQTSPEVKDAIKQSDIIVIGPGCFFTSLIAPVLTYGLLEALSNSKAKKVWVANMSNFPSGHCDGWKLSDYIGAFERFWGDDFFDQILVHSGTMPSGYEAVVCDVEDSRIIQENFLADYHKNITNDTLMTISRNTVYHDANKLAVSIKQII